MEHVAEIVVALFTVVGLLTLAWLLFGWLLAPRGGSALYGVIPVDGDADGLEQAVKHLLWLRGSGLTRVHIVVLDHGLDEAGAARLRLLRAQENGVLVCTPETILEELK